jgi:hypothetical protein
MLDNIKNFLKKVENSELYINWKKDHPNSYISSCFSMGNDIKELKWQIDFYESDNKKITSFVIDDNQDIKCKEEEIFKQPQDSVKELDLGKVKIDLDKAILKIDKWRKRKFPGEMPSQRIFVLQNLDTIIWNITFINTSFNVLNVKIDAINGKLIENSLTSVMGFKDKKYDKSKIDKIF